MTTVLTINGSDSTGRSGIQADIRVITDLGADAVTAITSVTAQGLKGIDSNYLIPQHLVIGQIRSIYHDVSPKAVKVGMITDANTIYAIRDEIVGCRNIICAPVIISSRGQRLLSDEAVRAFLESIIPESRLLVTKAVDAEIMLGMSIKTDADMITAARRLQQHGAQWILIRGGHLTTSNLITNNSNPITHNSPDRLTALLYAPDYVRYFTTYDIDGWQQHGIGSALSTAIATRIAMDDDIPQAITAAHKYIHSQMIYQLAGDTHHTRPREICDTYHTLIAQHYRSQHNIAAYAAMLSVTPRYLSQVTRITLGKTPKEILDDYLMRESLRLIRYTSMSIQEISITLGFSSQILFGRFIKNKTGKSPTQLRVTSHQSS